MSEADDPAGSVGQLGADGAGAGAGVAVEASVQATKVRLCAIAQGSQVALAVKRPEGR